MERIFWVKCPKCDDKFYCDYGLRFLKVLLVCPFCEHQFGVSDSLEIDERWQ